jgi:hypothetical protein
MLGVAVGTIGEVAAGEGATDGDGRGVARDDRDGDDDGEPTQPVRSTRAAPTAASRRAGVSIWG